MYSTLDLFSGAGGFSLGLHEAGINCVGAVEKDRFAAKTYKANFPNVRVFEEDIADFSKVKIANLFSGIDIIAGGPPCQGFSVAGPAQYGKIDDRNKLLLEMIRFVQILKPKVCVLENVKGLLAGKLSGKTKALEAYMSKMDALGYQSSFEVLQAADFGVPQWRERVFVFSVRGKKEFPEIERTHGKNKKAWITVGEAILDLPQIESGEGCNELISYRGKPDNEYQIEMRKKSNGVTNHVGMKHTPRLIERFKSIPIGGSLLDVPSQHGQRKRNGKELDINNRFKSNNQRLDPLKISLAITASFQSNFLHPFKNRNLTAREGARLQSFPDRFLLEGPRTLMSKSLLLREGRDDEIGLSQYNQIGNAVPPKLAYSVGENIINYLKR